MNARVRRGRGGAIGAAGLLLAALAAPAAPAPASPAAPAVTVRDANAVAIAELLRSARLWQALGHPDDERRVLRKVLAVDAGDARALFLLAELEWRGGHGPDAERAFGELRARHPGSSAALEAQRLARVYARQKGGLAELRLALRGGNAARARALARSLFPDGRPPGDLANEFASLLASTPGGWENLRALFSARVAADPNPGDRLSLYELLARHADTRAEALRDYADLSLSHDAPPDRVAQAWRQSLVALGHDDADQAERRRFLQRYPADGQVRAAVQRAEAERAAAAPGTDDPAVRARLAAVAALDAGTLDEAEAQLQHSLALRPDDGETVGTLGLLRLRQGRAADALLQFESALRLEPPVAGTRARWVDLAATARYWSALQRARDLRAAGDVDGAVRLVESVQATQPDQTEATRLLASLRAQQGRNAEAESLYRGLIARDLGDARSWRALLSLYLQQGNIDAALDAAQDLPLRANVAVADALDAGALRDAVDRAGTAHPDAALRYLERGVALLPAEAWLRYDLAQQYRRLRLPALARQVMHDGMRQAPGDPAMQYATALVDAATDQEDAALAGVSAIPAARQTDGMRALAQRLRFERDLRNARTARAAGDAAADAHWRAQALVEAGDDPGRRLRVARAALSADDPAAARPLLDALRQSAPGLAVDDARGLVRALIDAGDPAAALALLDRMPAPAAGSGPDPERAARAALRARAHRAQHDASATRAAVDDMLALLPADDVAGHLEAVRILDSDRPAAQALMAGVLARHPQDPEVLLEAARQARRDHQGARALELLQQIDAQPVAADEAVPPLLALGPEAPAAAAAAPDGVRALAQQQRAAIEAQRQPHVDGAVMESMRSATDGISTLRGTEVPLLVVWPLGYDGHWFAQVDSVHLDAGILPAPLTDAAQYGKVLALAGPAGLPAPMPQSAAGLSAAAGWRGADRRFDVGIVGAGFKAPNIVGGWREAGQWGDTDVSAELSRRVLTGSLLSYAGAADPVTGEVWGGVTNTALNVRAARDFAANWSGSSSLTVGVLSGRNVPVNSMVQWHNVLERDWIRRPEFRLSAGGSLSAWHYGSNESFYTFGQGGYYSPQRYLSLGVPVEIEGRHGLLAYDVRATPSYSWTYEQDTPYYPGHGDLQALAGNPVHTAGAGGGIAGSLRAVLEYRLAPHWSAGAWIDIDRSAYYAPTQAMFYLRYWLPGQEGPMGFPPHPVAPISQY